MTGSLCGARLFDNGKLCLSPKHDDSRRCRDHLDTACYCCGEVDDPDGNGPAINTGFCAECKAAGCPDIDVGGPCVAEKWTGEGDGLSFTRSYVRDVFERTNAMEAENNAAYADRDANLKPTAMTFCNTCVTVSRCESAAKCLNSPTHAGIATGLSRALVALEARGMHEAAGAVRELLEATVDRHLAAPVEPQYVALCSPGAACPTQAICKYMGYCVQGTGLSSTRTAPPATPDPWEALEAIATIESTTWETVALTCRRIARRAIAAHQRKDVP